MTLDEHAIILGLDVETSDEAVDALAHRLVELDYVKHDFKEAVRAREKDYPTGLECSPVNAAIPHCSNEYSLSDMVGVAILKHPVEFTLMGSSDTKIPVKILLMPSIVDPALQVPMLVRLMEFLDKNDKVQALAEAQTSSEIVDIIGDAFDIED